MNDQAVKGGEFSNYQKNRIIAESPLIEIYKNIRLQLEDMFVLEHHTIQHSPPEMKRTFEVLRNYMRKNNATKHISGRKAKYSVPDTMAHGMHIIMTTDITMEGVGENDEGEVEGDGVIIEDAGDVEIE